MPKSCEVVEMRNSADAVGVACLKTASTQCSDCGSELCESHAETCEMYGDCLLLLLFVAPSGAASESRLSGSQHRENNDSSERESSVEAATP